MRTSLMASLALIATVCPAFATCRVASGTFYPSQNDHVTVYTTQSVVDICNQNFKSNSGLNYNAAYILERPRSGKLEKTGPLSFRYTPARTGVDRYKLKVCGTDVGGTGCSTLTYDVTIAP